MVFGVSTTVSRVTDSGEAMSTVPASDELDVIVIGGSQAGLAMAWHLSRQQLRFVVLEAGPQVGHTWRSRWDSLQLFTPRAPFRVRRSGALPPRSLMPTA